MRLFKEVLTFATGILVLVALIVPVVGLAVGEPIVAPPLLTADGEPLPQSAPFSSSLVATSSTVWDVVMSFEEDITTPAVVADGTPSFDFTNGTLQVVNDCGDGNAKTYCFTYVPPSGIEAAVFWFFRVSDAANAAGDYMATTTYRFIVDTAGPILSFTSINATQLPTVQGDSSFGSALVRITFSNDTLTRTYQTTAASGIWSLTLEPQDALPPGDYSIIAVGIDQYNNVGAPIMVSVHIPDTLPPELAEAAPIPESASTTPSYSFTSSEFASLAYGGACSSDTVTAATGTNSIVFNALVPGTYADCSITATDGAGNISAPLAVTPFTITTPPPPPPPSGPTDKDQCKNDGWKTFTDPSFKNQGACVSFVEKNKEKTRKEGKEDKDKKEKGDKDKNTGGEEGDND